MVTTIHEIKNRHVPVGGRLQQIKWFALTEAFIVYICVCACVRACSHKLLLLILHTISLHYCLVVCNSFYIQYPFLLSNNAFHTSIQLFVSLYLLATSTQPPRTQAIAISSFLSSLILFQWNLKENSRWVCFILKLWRRFYECFQCKLWNFTLHSL